MLFLLLSFHLIPSFRLKRMSFLKIHLHGDASFGLWAIIFGLVKNYPTFPSPSLASSFSSSSSSHFRIKPGCQFENLWWYRMFFFRLFFRFGNVSVASRRKWKMLFVFAWKAILWNEKTRAVKTVSCVGDGVLVCLVSVRQSMCDGCVCMCANETSCTGNCKNVLQFAINHPFDSQFCHIIFPSCVFLHFIIEIL